MIRLNSFEINHAVQLFLMVEARGEKGCFQNINLDLCMLR